MPYRVDDRIFQPGEIASPKPEHESYYHSTKFNDSKRRIEDILDNSQAKPAGVPIRHKSLYVFAELNDAIRFWVIQGKTRIYQVKNSPNTVSLFGVT